MSWGTASLRASVLSAALGLMVLYMYGHILRSLAERDRDATGAISLLAVLYVVMSPGFWWAATRPGPVMTGCLLFAASGALVVSCWRRPRRGTGTAAAVLAGLTLVEYPTAGLLTPVLIFILWAAHGQSRGIWRWGVRVGTAYVLGMALGGALLMVLWMHSSVIAPDAPLFPMTAQMTRLWLDAAASQVFPAGWLAVSLIVACCLLLAWHAWRRIGRHARKRSIAIQSALVATLLVLLLLPPHMMDVFSTADGRLVLPWIGLAAAFGLSATYLCRHLHNRLAAILLVALAASAVWRYPHMTARPAGALAPAWDAVLADVRSEDWMVSDGLMDAPLRLAARERGVELLFIHPALSGHPPYRDQLATRLANPRHRSLARISPAALIADRLAAQPAESPAVHFLAYPERIVQSGQSLRPHLARYEAAPADRTWAAADILIEHTAFWEHIGPALSQLSRRRDDYGGFAESIRAHLARIANDLGVVMEHRGETAHARACYEQALSLDPLNLSARINLAIATTGALADDVLARRIERECGPDLVARLARESGFIFSQRALYWLSGLCGLQEPDDLPADIVQDIARAYLSGEAQAALQRAEAAVTRHPTSRAAWMLMGALAFEAGDEARLDRVLDQMNRRDERWAPLLMALGRRAMEREDYPRAATLLNEAHALWPLNIRIMEALIQLDLHLRDDRSLERHMRDLLAIDPWNPWANFALGLRHVREQEPDLAESALRRAIGGRPFPVAYNNLAWLLYERDRLTDALFYARRAVELDPYAWAHWDTLAAVLMRLEAWDAAGEALRAALTLNPDSAETRARADAWSEATGQEMGPRNSLKE